LNRKESDFQYSKVLVISGGHFAHDVYSSFLAVFLPLLITKFELSMTLAASFTIFFRLPSLFNPLIGVISDRLDMRRWVIWAPAVTAVTMSLTGMAPSYAFLCILIFVAGISSSFFHVLAPVMIVRDSGNDLGKGMSFWMTAGELARTLGPLIAVWSVSLWGFEKNFPVMAGGVIASAFLYLALKDANPGSGSRTVDGFKQAWRSLRSLMIPLTGIMISRAFMVAAFVTFLPTYMVASGKSLWIGGVSLSVLECSGALGTFFGGTLSDRVGRQAVLAVAMPASSALMLAFLYASDWMIFPILLLLGCTLFAITPVNLAIVQDNSRHCRGTANGLFMGISFVTTALVTFLVGWLADQFDLKTAFTVSALFGFAGIPIILFLPKSSTLVSQE